MELEYNNKDFHILRCAQPDGMGYVNDDRALELMELGLIHKKPKEEWSQSGYEATKKGFQLYRQWLASMREKHKHIWKRSDYDRSKIDVFGYSEGNHNGPICVICRFSYCQHCRDEDDLPECTIALQQKNERIQKLQQEIDDIRASMKFA